jgi:4-amino-4-deoxy-L-arabinose transferase-like glycosyltransferase
MASSKYIEFIIWILLAALLICIVIMAAVPPVSRDALTHHLAVPKIYLQQGGIVEIPEIEFSYYPMNLDLLYMVPLFFGNDIGPKYIHFFFGLLTALLIYRFLRERTHPRLWALLGALLFLSLPVIVKLSITVYVDLGLVFFSTAALLFVMKWALGSRRPLDLVCAAVCCGLCLGTKYNGLITFFLLACSIPILYMRGHRSRYSTSELSERASPLDRGNGMAASFRGLGAMLLFISISIAVFSPWMIRNYRWTGNPVHPLYRSAFGSNTDGEVMNNPTDPKAGSAENDENLSHFVIRRRVFNETLFETLSTPVRIFFQGQDDNPKYFDGRLNPYLIIFPLLSFVGFGRLSRRRKIENLALFGFAVLYLLYAFFKVDMRIRYVAPIIPPLVILSVFGVESAYSLIKTKLTGKRGMLGRSLLAIAMLLLVGLNFQYLTGQFSYVAPLDYLSGKIRRDAYIQKYRSEYGAIQFINQRLTSEDRVMAVYLGNRIYYSDRPIVCNDPLMKSAIASSNSAEDLRLRLAKREFTHLLIQNEFFRQFILEQLSPEKQSMVRRFFGEKAVELFSQRGYSVFELTNH